MQRANLNVCHMFSSITCRMDLPTHMCEAMNNSRCNTDLQHFIELNMGCIDVLLGITASLHYPLGIP